MPMRSRQKPWLPRFAAMSLRPLWPATPPPSFSFAGARLFLAALLLLALLGGGSSRLALGLLLRRGHFRGRRDSALGHDAGCSGSGGSSLFFLGDDGLRDGRGHHRRVLLGLEDR